MRESLLVIDKEPGPSSFDLVRAVKRRVNKAKVGHTGTLDPFASGVVILLVGRATKLSNVLLNADKSYQAVVKLGEATDTMDRTGTVTIEAPVPELTQAKVNEVVQSFAGIWNQTPPMYSAKKIRGVRMYRLARENIKIRRAPIPVQLYRIDQVRYEAPFVYFELLCSKGTYVRSLAGEIGERLGTVAHLHELRRLSCGDFSIDESVKLEKLLDDFDAWADRGYENYRRFLGKERHLQSLVSNDINVKREKAWH